MMATRSTIPSSESYSPLGFEGFFNSSRDVPVDDGYLRVYTRDLEDNTEGVVFFLIHGGGFSALSFAQLVTSLSRAAPTTVCVAFDMRY